MDSKPSDCRLHSLFSLTTTTGSMADESTANLHLDEVTGERVSKSELKKRIKQRETEARKKAKGEANPKPLVTAQKKKTTSAEDDESNLNPNVSLALQSSP